MAVDFESLEACFRAHGDFSHLMDTGACMLAEHDATIIHAYPEWHAENARLREQAGALATALHSVAEQADAFAEIVSTVRNVYYWANNAAQRADPLAYLQSRLEYLADKAEAALRVYREPGSPAIRPIHTKYLDAQLDERCITCLERWPCKEASHE